MNQREAKHIVYAITVTALRNLARHPERLDTFREVPTNITEAGKKKVIEQARALAEKLSDKIAEREPIEHERELPEEAP